MKPTTSNFALPIIAFLFLAFPGCQPSENRTETPAHSDQRETVPLHTVDMVIEGMTCELSCAGRMYLKLNEMDGVNDIDIVFAHTEGNDDRDRARVAFDPKKLTAQDLISAVDAVGGGVYFVSSSTLNESVDGRGDSSEMQTPSRKEKEVSFAAPPAHYQLPNFFEVFSKLF